MPDTDHWKGDGMSENTYDRSALGHEAGKLLDALLKHVNEIGRAQVATSTLLKDSGLTQGALVRARAELTRNGLLRTERTAAHGAGLLFHWASRSERLRAEHDSDRTAFRAGSGRRNRTNRGRRSR